MKIIVKAVVMGALVSSCMQAADASVESQVFKASLTVEESTKCILDVNAGEKTQWNLIWSPGSRGAPNILKSETQDSSSESYVVVKFSDDSSPSCNLDNMRFESKEGAGATVAPDGSYTMGFGNSSFWRYMPVVTNLKLFTDPAGANDFSTGRVIPSIINVTDGNDIEHDVFDGITAHAGRVLPSPHEAFNNGALNLENSHLSAIGKWLPLPLHAISKQPSFSLKNSLAQDKHIKAALIGVGALVAINPEGDNGESKIDDLTDNMTIKLPFTVVVTNQ